MSSDLPPNEDRPDALVGDRPDTLNEDGPGALEESQDSAPLSEGASPPPEETPPGYIALKYTFLTPKRGDLCGAFCLVFEGSTGKVLFQTFWVTRSDPLADLRTSQDWRTFNKLISQIGPYDRVWGDKLAPLPLDLLPTSDRVELYQAGQQDVSRLLSNISGTIRKGYERVTHYFLDVSCDIERLSEEELVEAGILEPSSGTEDPTDAAASEEPGKSFAGVLVQCLPLVDPVHGKAASELEPGDVLEVQIQNTVGAGGLVQQFLKATQRSPIFPVDSVEKRDDKTYIYLTINEEMRGLLTLTKDLRLKTPYAAVEEKRQAGSFDNLIFFLLLGLAFFGFLLALQYLF